MKNRHIGLQITNLTKLLEQQAAFGWYEVDLLSITEDQTQEIKNGVFSVKFSRLDGSGEVKYYRVYKNGSVKYLGGQ